MAEEGLYAYALIEGAPAAADLASVGIGGAPLQVVTYDGVSAVVSPVDLTEFGEEGLRANLENLDWLREVAYAHDAVSRAAAITAPTAPLRLATVFRSADSVQARLQEWHDQAREVFARITGRSEWSVKAYTVPVATGASASAADRPASGRDYLLARKRATSAREQAAEEDQEVVQQLHHELHDHAVASRLLQPQDRTLAGFEGEMLLNAAYLVEDTVAEDFAELVRSRDGGARLRFTVEGPWAPYSFASLEDG